MQTSADAIYCARHVGLKAGLPITTPALTVNRLCGSGFQAIVNGVEQLLLDEADVVLVGGTENMTQAPHILRGARDGWRSEKRRASKTRSGARSPTATRTRRWRSPPRTSRRNTASRAKTATRTRSRASSVGPQRTKRGGFKDEIAPVDIVTKKGTIAFAVDEHPRPQTTMEILAKLPPVFKKDGVVTAGNASGICDGAAALVLTTEEFAKSKGLSPLARIVSWGVAGVDPTIMGIGPAPAIKSALERAQLKLSDMDLVEVNEAFAPQYLAVEKELGLDRSKTNVDGGAIALGHPLGASGARITTHLVYELARRKGKYAVGSACIGGGQGLAIVIAAV